MTCASCNNTGTVERVYATHTRLVPCACRTPPRTLADAERELALLRSERDRDAGLMHAQDAALAAVERELAAARLRCEWLVGRLATVQAVLCQVAARQGPCSCALERLAKEVSEA